LVSCVSAPVQPSEGRASKDRVTVSGFMWIEGVFNPQREGEPQSG